MPVIESTTAFTKTWFFRVIKDMRFSKAGSLLCCLLLFSAIPTHGQDINGYTNQYDIDFTPPTPTGSPVCTGSSAVNPSDSDEYIIRDTGGWSNINNAAYEYFYVCPGDYTSLGEITVTQSGVDSGADDLPDDGWHHIVCWYPGITAGRVPWDDSGNECQIEWIGFEGSDNWVMHGMEVLPAHSSESKQAITVGPNSAALDTENILLDYLLVDGTNQGTNATNTRMVHIHNYAINTTLQYSVVRNCAEDDNIDIEAISVDDVSDRTRIVANEVYDCGSQFFYGVGVPGASKTTAVVENNDMYYTDKMYRNCETGAVDVNGNCMCGESLLNLKTCGSSSSPMEVINNRFWGSRAQYNDCGGSGGGKGPVIEFLQSCQYPLLRGNIIFDNEGGVTSATCSNGNATQHYDVSLNIFAECENHATSGALPCGTGSSCGSTGVETCCGAEDPGHIRYASSTGCTSAKSSYYLNTFVDASNGCVGFGGGRTRDDEVKRNTFVDTGSMDANPSGDVEYNVYVGTSNDFGETEKRDGVDSVSDFDQYCFYRKLLTGPELKCIDKASPKTTIAPAFETYGGSMTLDSSYGVDPN